jgi:hypothetical protein
MKIILAMAIALIATAANAAAFTNATTTQAQQRPVVKYHLFVTYFVSAGVTTPIQLGPFLTATACSNAAALLATKVAIGVSACLKNQ